MFSTGNGGLSAADVAAVTNGSGLGNFGGDGGWWILLLFLFAMGGNWNNGGFGNNDIQRGFDQQATQAAISNVQQSIGNGFADAAIARCQGDAAITAAITNAQAATSQGMNALAMALQNCCCENRAGIADLKYTVATENCADRQAISDGLRDLMAANMANTQAIINSQSQGFQSIQDKLCQLELDGFKQRVSDLQAENAALRGAASQNAQTAAIIANNEAQTANLLARLNPNPIPAYVVQNPSCCNQTFGCGA